MIQLALQEIYGMQFYKHTKINTITLTSVKSIIFIILSFNCEMAIQSFVSGHSFTLILVNVWQTTRGSCAFIWLCTCVIGIISAYKAATYHNTEILKMHRDLAHQRSTKDNSTCLLLCIVFNLFAYTLKISDLHLRKIVLEGLFAQVARSHWRK